jgi:glyoxylase-like metal-dependent hydrolase (beta-lactamase superfamily II)
MSARAKHWMVHVSLPLLALACVPPLQAASRCESGAVIAAAVRAQGGEIHTVKLSGSGHDYVVGQGYQPGAGWPKFNVDTYERSVDLEAGLSSLRTIRSQANHPPRGGARQPFEHPEEALSAVAAGSARAAATRRELALLLAAGFIHVATQSKQVSARDLPAGACALTVSLDEGAPITADVARDGSVVRIESKAADDVLGDAVVETRFSGRIRAGSWNMPAHILQNYGGFPVLDLQVKTVSFNEPVAVAAEAVPPLPDWVAPASLPSEKLGDGVFVIPGRYSAVAVDMGDFMTVIEGPQSEARSLYIIGEAKKLIPGKPIRYVVNTHAHFDHTAGLRTFAAEGATIVTQKGNVGFFKDVLNRPRTLRPDVLSRSPRPLVFMPVGETATLEGAGREVRLYLLHGLDHTQNMLIAYMPGPKVLVEADAFTPPAHARTAAPPSINPYTVQLLNNLERLHLDVDRLISIHYAADGRRVGMDELRLAAGR